jgi:hypothetical protein
MNPYLAAGEIPPGWIWIAVSLTCGVVGAYVAKNRGNAAGQGFAWGALLGPLGLIVVATQPVKERKGQ